MSSWVDRDMAILELRVDAADPEDDGVYQISKNSLRAVLDALDEAQDQSDKFEATLGRLSAAVDLVFPEWADD